MRSKASKTARDNREAVWTQLRLFVKNGWVRAFPPSVTHILDGWRLRVSSTHFVEKTTYNKADLGNLGNAEDGQDANTLSPDLEYANVQADFIDTVAEAICQDMQSKTIDSEELEAIKADIKAAVMQVPVHLLDIGTLCMEFEGWSFVFVRIPFGWKWATHTSSVFTAALKLKIQNCNQYGWGNDKVQHAGVGTVERPSWRHKGMMDPWYRMIRRYCAVGGARAALLEDGRDMALLMKRARLVWSRF